MLLSDKTMKYAIVACSALAAAMLIFAGFLFWQNDSADSAGSPLTNGKALNSALGAGSELDKSEVVDSDGELAFDCSNPFGTNVSPSSTVHKVVFRATSDGPIGRLGYVVRWGSTKTVTTSQSSWSTARSVRGPRPVAQLAVQVSAGSTYARCTIVVDGKQASSYVARGVNHVVVCTA
ncbi:MAG: hypothetical protein M3Q98_01165 [Actinomycetota bacterium]|nr:hypothetical protein [Actinomycetota bacterium]